MPASESSRVPPELHVQRGEPRPGRGPVGLRGLGPVAGVVQGLGRGGAALLHPQGAVELDAREALLHLRGAQRRAGLVDLGLEQLALELDQHLLLDHGVAGLDVDDLDDAGHPRPDLDLVLGLDGARRHHDALDPGALDLRAGDALGLRAPAAERRGDQREREDPSARTPHASGSVPLA